MSPKSKEHTMKLAWFDQQAFRFFENSTFLAGDEVVFLGLEQAKEKHLRWEELKKQFPGGKYAAVGVLFVLRKKLKKLLSDSELNPRKYQDLGAPLPYQWQNQLVVLTRRTEHLPSHKRQISFCGGHAEEGDLSPLGTVSREVGEELGLPFEELSFGPILKPQRSVTGRWVFPVLCQWSPASYVSLRPCPDEVEKVLFVDPAALARDSASNFELNVYGKKRTSYLFDTDAGQVWGLTAKILHQVGIRNLKK